MTKKPVWPKSKLLRHGPELPIAERVRRYQHNIRMIRASGCAVPTIAFVNTLDPVAIKAWFREGEATAVRLRGTISKVAKAMRGQS